MTRDEFWDVIDEARRSVATTSDIPNWLEGRLSQLADSEIVDFRSHFDECMDRAYDARLWLAAVVLLRGCGDDSFCYFRGGLIAQGRKTFEAALIDPDSLAELGHFDADPRLEEMLYVDTHAYLKRLGRDCNDLEARKQYQALQPRRVRPALQRPELLDVSDEDAAKLYPKLATRFPSGIRWLSPNEEA
jgi:hypothetical protein